MDNENSSQTGFVEFSLELWRQGFLNAVLYITSAIGLVGILVYVFTSRTPVFTFIAVGCYLVLLAFTFLKIRVLSQSWFLSPSIEPHWPAHHAGYRDTRKRNPFLPGYIDRIHIDLRK